MYTAEKRWPAWPPGKMKGEIMNKVKCSVSLLLAVLFLIAQPTELAQHALAETPDDAETLDSAEALGGEEAEICLRPIDPSAAKWRGGGEGRWPEQEPIAIAPPAPRRWTDNDVAVLSRMVWGEGRGVSRNEQKLIVWTVINRLEDGRYGSSLIGIVRARGQFHGYSARHPVTTAIRDMVTEVLEAWDRGEGGKVYPPFATTPCYRYFWGDGRHNWFRTNWRR